MDPSPLVCCSTLVVELSGFLCSEHCLDEWTLFVEDPVDFEMIYGAVGAMRVHFLWASSILLFHQSPDSFCDFEDSVVEEEVDDAVIGGVGSSP